MRRLSLWLALALVAGCVSIVVAPQMIILAIRLIGDTSASAQAIGGFVAQEIGLWGSSLATAVVAQRLGWQPSRSELVALLLFPVAAEAGVALLFGVAPAAYGSAAGGAARLLAGAGAIAAGLRLRRQSL